MKKIQTASTGFAVVVFLVYIIAQGCGFGMIFGLYDVTQLSLTFGIGGAIFLVTGLIGTMLSDKAMMSLKKMLTIGGMVYLGLMVILMVSLMIRLFVTGL